MTRNPTMKSNAAINVVGALFITALFTGRVLPIDGPSLEQIDLFQSGTNDYHTYRIPSLLVTKQGTVLAFVEGASAAPVTRGTLTSCCGAAPMKAHLVRHADHRRRR